MRQQRLRRAGPHRAEGRRRDEPVPEGQVEIRLRGSVGDLAEAAARLAEEFTVVAVNGPHPNRDDQHRLFVHAKLQPPVPPTT